MERYFVLDERGEPRHEPDVEVWSQWYEDANRLVARTLVSPDVTVLTTFRGVDDSDSEDPPRLFETRVFGGVLDGEEAVYETRAEALEGHSELADWCRLGNDRDAAVSRMIA